MAKNFLEFNDNKTELIVFGSPSDLEKMKEWTADVAYATMVLDESVRNIGTMIDIAFTMEHHVNHIEKVGYFQLR